MELDELLKQINSILETAEKNPEAPLDKMINELKNTTKKTENTEKFKIPPKVIKHYNIEEITTNKEITLTTDLNKNDIQNFQYINEDTTITIMPLFDQIFHNTIGTESFYDEKVYFENLKRIFNILKTHNRTYNIKIQASNRELLKQSQILESYPLINFTINSDFYDYSKEEFQSEEQQLEELIQPINKSNLSTYEKFLVVYNIVKQFKEYKENYDAPLEARNLKYITKNEYIVCSGFQNLLENLLHKVGIPITSIHIETDLEPKENEPSNLEAHSRGIIKIDDDKYNIHGIFIVDSTWDNSLNHDLYNFAAITFDRHKEGIYIESLNTADLLLDFHNTQEFSDKINYYLKREITCNQKRHNEKDSIIIAYQTLFYDIINFIGRLDYEKYKYFYNKYYNQISNNDIDLKTLESIYSEFLSEYAKYILPLSNQKIDNKTLYTAISNVKQKINNLTPTEIANSLNQIKQIHEEDEHMIFPYEYDPNNEIPNYLTSKKR